MTSSKEGMSDCATAGEEPPSGMCTAFVPHVTLTCAVCGQPATAHVGAAHAGLVAALEDVLRTAGTALETLRAAAAEDAETADAAAVDAADGLVRGATARLEAALDAVIAPERARARAGVARRQRAARRARVLAELVATEDEYAHDLATLLDVWRPAVAAAGVLDARQTALVFGDVPRLLYLARTLAEQLHAVAARPPAAQDLGAVLLRTVPFMRVYVDQCGSVPRVTELLHTVATRPQYIQAQSVCTTITSSPLSRTTLLCACVFTMPPVLCALTSPPHSACSRTRGQRTSTSRDSSSSRPSGSRSTRSSSATSSRPPSPTTRTTRT